MRRRAGAARPVNLYPAIDILGGSAVRLTKGDFEAKKVYDADPRTAAEGWVHGGARWLHVVDLDGAKEGAPANLRHLERIAGLGVPVQFGGGLRSAQAIEEALAAGAVRVILGTAAFADPELLEQALAAHGPGKVLVSVDVRGGHVATHGWLATSALPAGEAFAQLRERGVRHFVSTSIDRDGMLDGADREEVVAIARAVGEGASAIYSGGIGTLADLESLALLRREQGLGALEGVIVGKALYEGRFTIAQAQAALGG
jgi:phosphoribosylformimino-5-aminoimidazole carboxamide ribotide isomerase